MQVYKDIWTFALKKLEKYCEYCHWTWGSHAHSHYPHMLLCPQRSIFVKQTVLTASSLQTERSSHLTVASLKNAKGERPRGPTEGPNTDTVTDRATVPFGQWQQGRMQSTVNKLVEQTSLPSGPLLQGSWIHEITVWTTWRFRLSRG